MPKTPHVHPADLVGYSRLTIDGILGLSEAVETAHRNIAASPGKFGPPAQGPTSGITGLVYNSIRVVTALVGSSLQPALTTFAAAYGKSENSTPEREAVVSALNGAIGDYLFASGNPLAILMRLRRNGQPLTIQKEALTGAIPRASGKLLVLVHGLGLSDLRWSRPGHDYGARLARDLGYTALYLHYNSGMHISERTRVCRVARESRGAVADAGKGASNYRPQHGRVGNPQRLPLWRDGWLQVAAAAPSSCVPWDPAPRRAASTLGQPAEYQLGSQPLYSCVCQLE